MSAETARIVFLAAMGSGVFIWLLGLVAHRRAFSRPDPLDPELVRGGEVEVDAPTEQVRDRLVEALRGGGGATGGSVLIEEASPDRVAGKITLLNRRGSAGSVDVGFGIVLGSLGGRTAAVWRLTKPVGGGGLLFVGRLFVYVLAPAALAAAAILIPTYVLPSESAAVRGQAAQAFQVVHFVWPPFLVAWIHKRVLLTFANVITNLIRNTAF